MPVRPRPKVRNCFQTVVNRCAGFQDIKIVRFEKFKLFSFTWPLVSLYFAERDPVEITAVLNLLHVCLFLFLIIIIFVDLAYYVQQQ